MNIAPKTHSRMPSDVAGLTRQWFCSAAVPKAYSSLEMHVSPGRGLGVEVTVRGLQC